MSALLQTLRNEHGWDFQTLHALNMSVALHTDSRPTRRQAEVSCLALVVRQLCSGFTSPPSMKGAKLGGASGCSFFHSRTDLILNHRQHTPTGLLSGGNSCGKKVLPKPFAGPEPTTESRTQAPQIPPADADRGICQSSTCMYTAFCGTARQASCMAS